MKQEAFHYGSLEEVRRKLRELGVCIPLSERTEILSRPLPVGGGEAHNRLAVQPMEGCDGEADGSPGELTFRRYRRFAKGGAGLIWAEAVAVVPEGRANPRQLMLTEKNAGVFRKLVEEIKETCYRENGFYPMIIMQETHSGRYSRPQGAPKPLAAYRRPEAEAETVVSDDYLRRLEERYAVSARLAEHAGFDGADVKACHGYLVNELLSAHGRSGEYGGSFENRTRFLRDAVAAVRASVSRAFVVASRLNLYDGLPGSSGWGDGESGPDLSEPVRLVRELHGLGLGLLNCTAGNPYSNPHVNRPYDSGPYEPPEHPLAGVARMCACAAEVKRLCPELPVVGSGNSYLRGFSSNQAAGMVENGWADVAGFGRMAIAYPDFASDLLKKGALDPRKCCVACSRCTQLMRAGSVAGCVVRDGDVYAPIYRRNVIENPEDIAHRVSVL